MTKFKKEAVKNIKRMAILAPIILLGVFTSCNSDDNGPNFDYVLTRIDSVDIPDTVLANESYKFDIYYEKPSDCFKFNGFNTQFDRDEDEYIISATGAVYKMDSCQNYATPKIKTAQLNFNSQNEDSYVLKFLKDVGVDSLDNNQPVYITKEIIVAKEN